MDQVGYFSWDRHCHISSQFGTDDGSAATAVSVVGGARPHAPDGRQHTDSRHSVKKKKKKRREKGLGPGGGGGGGRKMNTPPLPHRWGQNQHQHFFFFTVAQVTSSPETAKLT